MRYDIKTNLKRLREKQKDVMFHIANGMPL